MKLRFPKEESSVVQICNHCGHDVSRGSGKFVNRIPDLNDVSTRIANGLLFPTGDFVCEECDNNSLLTFSLLKRMSNLQIPSGTQAGDLTLEWKRSITGNE